MGLGFGLFLDILLYRARKNVLRPTYSIKPSFFDHCPRSTHCLFPRSSVASAARQLSRPFRVWEDAMLLSSHGDDKFASSSTSWQMSRQSYITGHGVDACINTNRHMQTSGKPWKHPDLKYRQKGEIYDNKIVILVETTIACFFSYYIIFGQGYACQVRIANEFVACMGYR